LHDGASGAGQNMQLVDCLNSFGGRRHARFAIQRDDRVYNRIAVTLLAASSDERLIDLDPIATKSLQITERRIARAEVVHYDVDAERMKLHQRGRGISRQDSFADFLFQPTRREPWLQLNYGHRADQTVALGQHRGEVS
jgi:hypothetical protein